MGHHVIFLISYIYKIAVMNSKTYLPKVSVSSIMAQRLMGHGTNSKIRRTVADGPFLRGICQSVRLIIKRNSILGLTLSQPPRL